MSLFFKTIMAHDKRSCGCGLELEKEKSLIKAGSGKQSCSGEPQALTAGNTHVCIQTQSCARTLTRFVIPEEIYYCKLSAGRRAFTVREITQHVSQVCNILLLLWRRALFSSCRLFPGNERPLNILCST